MTSAPMKPEPPKDYPTTMEARAAHMTRTQLGSYNIYKKNSPYSDPQDTNHRHPLWATMVLFGAYLTALIAF